MTASFLPFYVPDISEAEIAEVVDTLRSGWITTGLKVKRFETEFALFLGDPSVEAVAVNSATAGLHLALEALGIGPGDEVITSTHTFTATAEVVRYLGADVVLVDIDPKTLNIDPRAVEAAVTPRTKAIIPVHYAGLAVDMTAILEIAHRYHLKVIEDAAHALPTTYGGRLIGTLDSDATVFSFYANKNITTGEGGMLVTRHHDVAARAKVMRLHGIDRDAYGRFTAKAPRWYYEVIAPGFKYNLTDIAAALGLQQLKRLPAFLQRRTELAAQFNAQLADLPLLLPPQSIPGETHAWHFYVVRLSPQVPVSRNRFIELMFEAGIDCSVHYTPLHLQPYWQNRYHLKPEQFPHSQYAYEQMVSLPLYTRMSDADVTRVCNTVRRILQP